jgi:hypothetical protein
MFKLLALALFSFFQSSPPPPTPIPYWDLSQGQTGHRRAIIQTAGWTQFTPSADTQAIYVSSSIGDDSNNGLWPGPPGYVYGTGEPPYGYTVPAGTGNGPKRTIGAATQLLRDGYPDWLLLMKGDTFNEGFADTSPIHGYWILHGRSATERMVISSYGATGAPRPIIDSGWNNCFTTWNQAWQGHWMDSLALVSLHLTCDADNAAGQRGANRGIQLFGASNNCIIEDCKIENFQSNIVLFAFSNAVLENCIIRRNIIANAYNNGGTNSGGLYASEESGLLVEENIFDHNGWLDTGPPPPNPDWFNRNIYLQNLSDIPVNHINPIVRGNIIYGTDGLQQRPGGVCDNNLFIANGINLSFGSGNTPEPAGVSGEIIGNVIIGGRDFYYHDVNNARGWGLNIGNTVNTLIANNIVAHNAVPSDGIPGGSLPIAWELNFDNGHGSPQGMQNDVFQGNIIYDWPANYYASFNGSDGVIHFGSNSTVSNLTFTQNQFQDSAATHPVQVLMYLEGVSPNGTVASQIHSSQNTWHRNVSGDSPSNGTTFDNVNIFRTFNQFMADCGDSTSTWSTPNYPDPNRTVGSWHVHMGQSLHGVIADGTIARFMQDCEKQTRDRWDLRLMPTYNNTVAKGPIGYIRAGFGK